MRRSTLRSIDFASSPTDRAATNAFRSAAATAFKPILTNAARSSKVAREDAIARTWPDRTAKSRVAAATTGSTAWSDGSRSTAAVHYLLNEWRARQRPVAPRHSCGSHGIVRPVDGPLHRRSARHGCNDTGAASRNPGREFDRSKPLGNVRGRVRPVRSHATGNSPCPDLRSVPLPPRLNRQYHHAGEIDVRRSCPNKAVQSAVKGHFFAADRCLNSID